MPLRNRLHPANSTTQVDGAAKDPLTRRVYDSYMALLTGVMDWDELSEMATATPDGWRWRDVFEQSYHCEERSGEAVSLKTVASTHLPGPQVGLDIVDDLGFAAGCVHHPARQTQFKNSCRVLDLCRRQIAPARYCPARCSQGARTGGNRLR